MGFTQTVVATFAVVLLIIVTLSLNESVFKETDLMKDVGKTCNAGSESMSVGYCIDLSARTPEQCAIQFGDWNASTYTHPTRAGPTEPSDTRELLYGTLSVRGASISALVLGGVAFLIAYYSKSLDIDMESKYEEGSYMLSGTPRAYFAGVLFRLCAAGAVLATTLSTLLVVPALGVEAKSMHGVNRSMTFPSSCEDLGPNHIQRFEMLSAMLVLSISSVVAVGFMVYAIKYDAKASA